MTSDAKGIGEDGTELDGVFTLKEEQNMALRDFHSRKDGFTFLLTGFGRVFLKIAEHHSSPQICLLFHKCDPLNFSMIPCPLQIFSVVSLPNKRAKWIEETSETSHLSG